MKNVAFTTQVFGLLIMLPIVVALYINHAAHDFKSKRPITTEALQKQNAGSIPNVRNINQAN